MLPLITDDGLSAKKLSASPRNRRFSFSLRLRAKKTPDRLSPVPRRVMTAGFPARILYGRQQCMG